MLDYVQSTIASGAAVFLKNFKKNEDGATAVEYGLIIALIAVAVIAAVSLLGERIDGAFGAINTELAP